MFLCLPLPLLLSSPPSDTLQVIVVSLMVGSLFFRLGHRVQDARSFHGAAFMAVLFMAMGSMPQTGVVMAQKAVWLKHRDSLLYPGYAHGVVSVQEQQREAATTAFVTMQGSCSINPVNCCFSLCADRCTDGQSPAVCWIC